jgi:hypothetical protein
VARRKLSPWGFIGMGAMACVLFLVVATAWIAPWWVTLLLLVLWAAFLLTGSRWFEPHPTRVPWLALVVFATWAALVSVGVRVWGWS